MLDENYDITGNPLEGWTPVTQTEADIINNLDGNNKPVSNYAFLPVIKNVNGNMMLNFAFCWNPRRRPSAVKQLESPVKGIVNVEFDVKTTVESFFAPVEIRSNDNRILSKIILNETDTTYKDCIKVISPLSDTKTHPGLDGFSWKGYGNKTIRIRAVLNSNTKTQSVYVIDAQTNELLAYTENVPFFESSGSCAVGEILISDLYMNGSGSTWSGNLMIDNLHI